MTKEKRTLSQLEQYLSKAAWILKGPVDASDFKVYIFPLLFFNPVFAVEIVMRVSNTMQISDSGYFLAVTIVNYFEVKKYS